MIHFYGGLFYLLVTHASMIRNRPVQSIIVQ